MSKFLLILILLLVLINIIPNNFTELFSASYQTFQSYVPINANKYPMYPLSNSPYNWFYNFFPIFNSYTNFPWWNTSLGNTSNMSYDLRGDPLVIPRTNYVWNNPTNFPIYNPPI